VSSVTLLGKGFNGGRYSAFGLTSSQGGDRLTQSHTLTAGSSRYFLQLLVPGLDWLLTDSLHLQVWNLDWLPSRSNSQLQNNPLCSLGANRKLFLHCCVGRLLGNGSDIVACLHSGCLAMAVSLPPLFYLPGLMSNIFKQEGMGRTNCLLSFYDWERKENEKIKGYRDTQTVRWSHKNKN
jgi:hypothetical protein